MDYWTGVHCGECGSRERYVPNYLYTLPTGAKAFGVAREIEHKLDCTVPARQEYGDWIDEVRGWLDSMAQRHIEDVPTDWEAYHHEGWSAEKTAGYVLTARGLLDLGPLDKWLGMA